MLRRSVLIAAAVAVSLASLFAAVAPSGANSAPLTLTCTYNGSAQWTLRIPASAVPSGVTPTLTLTPANKVGAPAAYGKVCTFGPANIALSLPVSLTGSASGLQPGGYVAGAGWLPLAIIGSRARSRLFPGFEITRAGDYGLVPASALTGEYSAPAIGAPPKPVTGGDGTLKVTITHVTDQASTAGIVGLGDKITAVAGVTSHAVWSCSGEGPVAEGIGSITNSPAIGANPTYAPTKVTNGTVTSDAQGVHWNATALIGSCPKGGLDGRLPTGNYSTNWVVGNVEQPSQTTPAAWSRIVAAFTDERGGSAASIPFAPFDCTCTAVPSTTALKGGMHVTVTGAHWLDGTVDIVLGDRLVATTSATGTGSFSVGFTVPSVILPTGTGAGVSGLKLWAVGPKHRLAQTVAIS